MSFYDIYTKYKNLDFDRIFSGVTDEKIEKALNAKSLTCDDLLSLLSPKAEGHMERLAAKAHAISLQSFGRTIQLYTPIYVSNYCENECIYCGFNAKNAIPRRKLTLEELEAEAEVVASTGLGHVLLLCGESKQNAHFYYIESCIEVLKKFFPSVSIEIYPLDAEEYSRLIAKGLDGLTIYQEVYDEETYCKVHLTGPKKNYRFRLDAPERAAGKGIRTVNIGALLGLADWRKEVFFTALHAKYLEDRFPATEVSVSLPRIRPETVAFKAPAELSDANLVQAILALRIFLARVGITLSTREEPLLRERLIPLGVTKMSAGSTTVVGGRTIAHEPGAGQPQFRISDERSVSEIREMISRCGYQPVFKDWISGLA